jgi:hypothetical protein
VDEPGKAPLSGPRLVIDATLDDGHALWVADVDGDGDDEVFAGHRGKDHRVSMYDRDRASGTWTRTILDRDIAAQDLRGGDLELAWPEGGNVFKTGPAVTVFEGEWPA